MHKITHVFVICLLMAGSLFADEQTFIKPKKEKKISANALRNDCASISGDVVKLIAECTQHMAQLQGLILDVSIDHLEGDSASYLAQADKKCLQDYAVDLEKVQEKMEALLKEVRQTHAHIKADVGNIKKPN